MPVMFVLLYILACFYCVRSHVLLQAVSGEVERGKFTYWSLNLNGNIILSLKSLSGDADLYISEQISKPDFEPDNYDLHSASCGVDSISVPDSFKRPIGIGIYGHPSHETSHYLLKIYYDSDADEDPRIADVVMNENQSNTKEEKQNDQKKQNKISRELIMPGFWILMEIFELLFS